MNTGKPGVLLQAFYRRGGRGVPSPADHEAVDWWWDHLAKQAHELRTVGFTTLWLPPVTKGAAGTASVGYDVFDDYDLGSKHQKGAVPTRYGTREQLERCVAMLRANDLEVYVDLVENQRQGAVGAVDFFFATSMPMASPMVAASRKTPWTFTPMCRKTPMSLMGCMNPFSALI